MVRALKDIEIPLRDGARLRGDLYRPDEDVTGPAVLVQSPYGKEKLGAALPHPSAHSWLDFWDQGRWSLLIVDWRGYHASREAGDGPPVPHRGEDGYDLVQWLAGKEWCDGRVALWGPSALGRAALRTAVVRPPALVAAVPLVCHMGHYFEDFYPGGVLEESHLKAVDALGFEMVDQVLAESRSGSEFWRSGAAESRPGEIEVPVLLISGWYDLHPLQTIQFFNDLREQGAGLARSCSRLLVGPWHHTAIDQRRQGALSFPGAVGEAARRTRDFLSRCFDGRPETIPGREAPVRYWTVGEEGWTDSPAWPPDGTGDRDFHLHPDGSLAEEPPGGVGRHAFRDDPDDPVPTYGGANLPIGIRPGPLDQARKVESRDDVLLYTTEPLSEPLRLAGRPRVVLTAVTDQVDTDLAVRLTEVTSDGRSILVGDSVGRARCRGSRSQPVLVTPAVPFEVTVELPPMAQTFPAGSRIRISVSGSNWPRFERNPHTGDDHFDPDEALPAVTSLLLGGDSRSFLTLPALP